MKKENFGLGLDLIDATIEMDFQQLHNNEEEL